MRADDANDNLRGISSLPKTECTCGSWYQGQVKGLTLDPHRYAKR